MSAATARSPAVALVRACTPAELQADLPALTTLLIERAETVPDVGSNQPKGKSFFVNKWLSDTQLFRDQEEAIRALVAVVERQANAEPWPHVRSRSLLEIVSMWAMVSRRGMAGRPHRHAGAVSGAFYVDAGQGATSEDGALVMHAANGTPVKAVRPKPGLLLLWPSRLLHSVNRYDGDCPRIVISFNLAPRTKAGIDA